MRAANLVVRFLLELSALAATAYWGFATASGVTQWVLGLGAPALVAVVWGLFVSPKARIAVPRLAALAIELLLLGLVAVGLAAAGPLWLGIAYGAVALVSGVMNFVLGA